MSQIFIIAEAGVNHNGSLDTAMKLVDAAKQAGADAVKFQTFKAEKMVSRTAEKAVYQKRTTGESETQLEMISRLELSADDHYKLVQHCDNVGIEFFSTAFDLESINLLKELEMRVWKIPSGEITNLPFLRVVGAFGQPIILSTGMATLGEVEAAIGILEDSGTPRSRLTVLHCTTEYPAPLDEVNLLSMVTMGKAFGVSYGYSDHTQGISVPIAAAALGATIIEKHFTLDKTMEGPDHKASLEPDELESMVNGIHSVEIALGDGIKRVTQSESSNRPIARKSIVATRPILAGQVIEDADLTVKRPGTGISPMAWDQVIGRTATKDYVVDEEIQW